MFVRQFVRQLTEPAREVRMTPFVRTAESRQGIECRPQDARREPLVYRDVDLALAHDGA